MPTPQLSKLVLGLKPSATVAMATKAREMKAAGIDVISMTAGEPDFPTPKPILDHATQAVSDPAFHKYTSIPGHPDLIEAMRFKFKRDQGLELEKDQVMASVGGKSALAFALQAMCGPGDEVILFNPCWVSYAEQVYLAGATPVFVQSSASSGYVPSLEDFKQAISPKTKVVMLNTPNNPSGAMFPESFLKSMMDELQGTGIWLISDEIYEHLVFDDNKHTSPVSFGEDARSRTLVISGVAKSYAMTGWRLGVSAGPKEIIKAMCKIQSQVYTCPAGISQAAGAFAMREPEALKPMLQQMKAAYQERRDALCDAVAKDDRFSIFKAQGAFYGLLNVSALCGQDDVGFANRLLEEKHVAVVPGTPFGAPGSVRLSLASSMDDILTGWERIREMA